MNELDTLLDLKKTFINNKNYKGYMVKQVIDKIIEAGSVESKAQ